MGVISDLAGKVKAATSSVVPESKAIQDKQANINNYLKAVGPQTPATAKPTPVTPDADRLNPHGHYGDRPGEKRLDTHMPMYHSGTPYVKEDGPAMLQKGEAVVSKQDNPIHQAFDLIKGEDHKKPAKTVKHVHVRKAGKGYIAENHHTDSAAHPMEESALADMAGVHAHMDQHMGPPMPTEGGDPSQAAPPEQAPQGPQA